MRGVLGRGALAGVSLVLVALALSGSVGTAPAREEPATGLRAQAPGSVKQEKLESRLAEVALAYETGGQSAAGNVAQGEGFTVEAGLVRTVVVAREAVFAEAAVRAAGGEIEATYGRSIQALVPPGALETIAANAQVAYVRPPLVPVPDAIAGEGVGASQASPWHAAGRTGEGAKVAVIDLGFAGYADRQAEGDLPATLTTVDLCGGELATSERHGTGVAEILHEMAPSAELTLICIDSDVTLGQAKDYVKANGIRIVNHSVGWFNAVRGDGKGGPGTIDAIVSDARAAGVLWVNSAGNQAEDHWSGTYNDTNGDLLHNFTSTDQGNTFFVPGGGVACVYLKWDSWPATSQDFDLYLGHSASGELFASSTSLQNGSQTPTEGACMYTSADDWFFVAIDRFAATAKPRFDLTLHGGYFMQYQSSAGSINELAASPDTFAVAALCWQSNTLEPFSSRGPTIDGRVKPDISGFDAVSNATYGPATSCGSGGFTGTSAASPHVAGAAALVLGQNPGYSVTQLQSALTGAAVDQGSAGKDNLYGSGRLRVPPIQAPSISSLSPTSATGGSTVTINGARFTGTTGVSFNGVPASSFAVASSTKITAKVPPTAMVGPIQVTTPDGVAVSGTFKPVPRLTVVSPSPAQAGDALVLAGSNLVGATSLRLGSLVLPIESGSATEIQSRLPLSGAVTNSLTVVTPGGTSAGLKLGVRPTVASFAPSSAPAGTQVVLLGQTFAGTTKVTFGAGSATAVFSVLSASQLRATVPNAAVSGPITVTNAGGATTSAEVFSVQPKLSSFTPSSGVAGTVVSISGLGLAGANAVTFGGVSAAISGAPTATQVKALVPAGASVGKIEVQTPEGTALSSTDFKPVPKLTLASPSPAQAGDALTLTGSNLAGATSLKLGTLALPINANSATEISTQLPSSGALTNNLTVVTPGGTSAGLKLGVRPTIASLDPASAPAGSQVLLSGQTFTGTTKVTFGAGSATAAFSILSATQLRATVPNSAVSGPITVTNAGGSTASGDFMVLSKISSFAPASGVAGTQVTISGYGFAGASSVKFNGVEASAVSNVTATSLKARVPPGATTGPISITTSSGTGTSPSNFTIPLTIIGFSPTSGQEGDEVLITGFGFVKVTGVKFGNGAAEVQVLSDNQILAVVPSGATDGPVVVSNGSVSVPSAASFDVIEVGRPSQRIVFEGDNWGHWDIYRVNGDGSGLLRLTTSPAADFDAAWSPDGTRVVFASDRTGNDDIWVMNADGSGQTQLLELPSSEERAPAWSPDGTKIAFVRDSGLATDIWVMNADGSDAVNLTNYDNVNDTSPAWSPDGSQIAFASNRPDNGVYDIYVMNADGTGVAQVTSEHGSESWPDWSRDGLKLVFHSLDQVKTVNIDGSGVTSLAPSFGSAGHPSWSPCDRIAYTRASDIYIMLEDGSMTKQLTFAARSINPDCWASSP